MKKTFVAASTALALGVAGGISAAQAGEVLGAPQFYLGVHGGYLGGDGKMFDGPGTKYDTSNASHGIVGALAGVNFRNSSPWFFGIEGDVGITLNTKVAKPCPTVNDLCKITSNYHVRGRIGHALGPVDLFVAAGLALMQAKANVLGPSFSKTLTGYTIGAGVDAAVTDKAILRVEVLHDDFGKKDFSGGYGVKNWSGFAVRAAAIMNF